MFLAFLIRNSSLIWSCCTSSWRLHEQTDYFGVFAVSFVAYSSLCLLHLLISVPFWQADDESCTLTTRQLGILAKVLSLFRPLGRLDRLKTALGKFSKNKLVEFQNLAIGQLANSDFLFTFHVLVWHFTTWVDTAAISPGPKGNSVHWLSC